MLPIINSIDNNGKKNGYDLDLLELVNGITTIPIIVCGGVGKSSHFDEAMKFKFSGFAAGNFFNFTEHSVNTTKRFLKRKDRDIRIDTYANYLEADYGNENRVGKYSDLLLEKLK